MLSVRNKLKVSFMSDMMCTQLTKLIAFLASYLKKYV